MAWTKLEEATAFYDPEVQAIGKDKVEAAIKADPKLKDMVLVTNSRLSVQPVSEAEFKHICKLGGVKA